MSGTNVIYPGSVWGGGSKLKNSLFQETMEDFERVVAILGSASSAAELKITAAELDQLTWLAELAEEFLSHYDRLETSMVSDVVETGDGKGADSQ